MKLSVSLKYDILSDYNDVLTVAFMYKMPGKEWEIHSIVAGESYYMMNRLEKWK